MSTFDSKIIGLCNRLDVKDAVIGLLDDSLKERDNRVTMLRTIIKDNDKVIVELSKTLEERDTRVLELLTTVVELRSTLEERDTIYDTHLKSALAIKDTINADLCKAIKEQCDALNHLRGVAVDNYVNVKRVRP